MTEVHGTCHPQFQHVRELLARHLEEGRELGASVYANVDGEDVVDLWGGWRDRQHTGVWESDTIVNVFSGSKTVTSLAALMLVDRGELDVYAPVADYWPEFAANGKSDVRVRHIMGHTSGVSGWEQPFSFEDAFDIEASTAKLAGQAPWWDPGTASVYHASTYGHLVAEIVRRVSGRTLRQFVADEIAGPLGASFSIGVDAAELDRVATIYPVPDGPAPEAAPGAERSREDLLNAKTRAGSFASTMGDAFTEFNSARWRRTEFGGSTGHGNARGIGRIVSALTRGGEVDGIRLLSPRTIDLIFDEQAAGVDIYYKKPIRWGIGYALASRESNRRGPLPFIRPGGKTCFWYGTGGACAIADVERGITFAYAMNQCYAGREQLNGSYYQAVYDALDGAIEGAR